MTRSIRGSVCALVLALGALVAGARTSSGQGKEDGWLARFNREREGRGVRPLLASPVLDQVAQAQAEEMAGERSGISATRASHRGRPVPSSRSATPRKRGYRSRYRRQSRPGSIANR